MAELAADDDLRITEVEILESMYTGAELQFPNPDDRFEFTITTADPPSTLSARLPPGGLVVPLPVITNATIVTITTTPGYPSIVPATISVQVEGLRRTQHAKLTAGLNAAVTDACLDETDCRVLLSLDYVRDSAPGFFLAQEADAEDAAAAAATAAAEVGGAGGTGGVEPAPPPQGASTVRSRGLMREWCSFVSLYKDSYASGPNRFEVMTALARERGLDITGMGIAGKPGGLVVEGQEEDVVQFMELMRTEFFETLNPRGRKLTTRLQERWPLDKEDDRYEAALAHRRLANDVHRSADRQAGKVKKLHERELLERREKEDRDAVVAYPSMGGDEIDKLIAAGAPEHCTTPGVYSMVGCEEPPTRAQIGQQRLWSDFSVFTGSGGGNGYDGAYQDAARIFAGLGQRDGFDAMFAYRFS